MGGIYWLASYPKSGNTWFRSFLRNLQDGVEAPADINRLAAPIASYRCWLDEVLGFDTADLTDGEVQRLRPSVYDWSGRAAEPSCHKIHDAYTWIDGAPLVGRGGTRGALYIVRNPLDVAPSLAHHLGQSVDEAIAHMGNEAFRLAASTRRFDSQVSQRLLTWSGHVESWVDASDLACLAIRYEDMLECPTDTFTRAVRFLGLPDDPERIDRAIRFSDFKVLADLEARHGFAERPVEADRFFRSGKAGGWRDTLSTDQVERIIADHGAVMRRFGYLDARSEPVSSSGAAR